MSDTKQSSSENSSEKISDKSTSKTACESENSNSEACKEEKSSSISGKLPCPSSTSRGSPSQTVGTTSKTFPSSDSSATMSENPFSKISSAILEQATQVNSEQRSLVEEKNVKADKSVVENEHEKVLKREYKQNHVLHHRFGNLDCKEKIVLCIDHSDSMFSNRVSLDGVSNQVFNAVTSALRHFLLSKYFINAHHEFSLVLVNEEVQLITELSTQSHEIVQMLHDIWNSKSIDIHDNGESNSSKEQCFDGCLLFKQLQSMVKLPPPCYNTDEQPPYIVRVIFVYGRPNCPVRLLGDSQVYEEMISNPNFFFDALYIHEASTENNGVEEVYRSLCDLDKHEKSYVLETELSSGVLGVFNSFTKLLYHPMQRQSQSFYTNLELQPLSESQNTS